MVGAVTAEVTEGQRPEMSADMEKCSIPVTKLKQFNFFVPPSDALKPPSSAAPNRIDLIDVDGNRLTDVSGSYGVNVCGYDEYKRFISEGWELTKDVGCVLGPLHPLVADNIDMLRKLSNKQEVSFHMVSYSL